jgi:hypothetical protein
MGGKLPVHGQKIDLREKGAPEGFGQGTNLGRGESLRLVDGDRSDPGITHVGGHDGDQFRVGNAEPDARSKQKRQHEGVIIRRETPGNN